MRFFCESGPDPEIREEPLSMWILASAIPRAGRCVADCLYLRRVGSNNRQRQLSSMTKKKRNTKWFWNRLNEYVSKENLKQSKQRNMIIESFLEMDDHVSAEDLHDYVKSHNQNSGLATIYRTLNLLKDAGLVEQKQFADGKAVFEVYQPNSHHDHLICVTCDRVIEFENDEIERIQEEVAKKHGLKLTYHRLDLFGECMKESCQYRPDGKI